MQITATVRGGIRRGAVAVETAMLMPIFILLVFFVMNMGLQTMTQVTMNSAVIAAARQMQIGTMRTSQSQVVNLICSKMQSLAKCSDTSGTSGAFNVYATSGTSFSALTAATVSGNGLSSTSFSPGSSGSFVLLEVSYYSPWYFPIAGLSNQVIVSTIAFENEF